MKVGIITLYGLSNYGNRLQNFAMEKALNELGCEAETVVMLPKIIKNGINFCKGNSVKSKRKRLFYNFTKENLHTKFYSNIKQFKDKYDFFIVGSDQIWHPCFTIYNKIRMLKFANSERCLSYAASFGVTKIPSYQKKIL